MARIEANGLGFEVADEGKGTPVVLLHGFPDTSTLWRHQVAALTAAGFRTIAPDMRGRGRSDRPAAVADYARRRRHRDNGRAWDSARPRRRTRLGRGGGLGGRRAQARSCRSRERDFGCRARSFRLWPLPRWASSAPPTSTSPRRR